MDEEEKEGVLEEEMLEPSAEADFRFEDDEYDDPDKDH